MLIFIFILIIILLFPGWFIILHMEDCILYFSLDLCVFPLTALPSRYTLMCHFYLMVFAIFLL